MVIRSGRHGKCTTFVSHRFYAAGRHLGARTEHGLRGGIPQLHNAFDARGSTSGSPVGSNRMSLADCAATQSQPPAKFIRPKISQCQQTQASTTSQELLRRRAIAQIALDDLMLSAYLRSGDHLSRLTELLRQARNSDPQLGADLEAEVTALTKRRTFGLVFEQHQPEAVELPGRAIRRGDKVRILPPRGDATKADLRLWRVRKIEGAGPGRKAHLEELDAAEPDTSSALAGDLVVVAEFRDTIYPGLVETGRVERGGDKPFHTVINGENYHALEMLTYTHRNSIDAIYIDPPYNTGAKDWKYNNNYVEGDDDYRHSKWLAFMERRLKVARELLRPDDSVLIVTIDEKEYLRLGLLLEQTFSEARIQMVSVQSKPGGVSRDMMFARSDEYYFFVLLGNSAPGKVPLSSEWSARTGKKSVTEELYWQKMRRTGSSPLRRDSPGAFYPVLLDNEGVIVGAGDALPLEASTSTYEPPTGLLPVWPTRGDGVDGRWQLGPEKCREAIAKGYLARGKLRGPVTTIYYLASGEQAKVESGLFTVSGRASDGSILVDHSGYVPMMTATTQWRVAAHSANEHGTRLLPAFIPGRKFPFPKSLYAVEDALRFFVHNKPNATILDFFSGSGTTAHAVIRLNKQDGGHRQCISITNNEVSAEEQKRLRQSGLRPGDAEWEAQGICDYITKPRVVAAITGETPQGEPVKGDYKFTDEFPMSDGFEENAAFFTLTYESPLTVRHNRAFARIAPLLWLCAGSLGRIITCLSEEGWDVSQTYGVLANLDHTDDFITSIVASGSVRLAFVVTDDDSAFQMVCHDLPSGIVTIRLYESYIQNFEINTGRSL